MMDAIELRKARTQYNFDRKYGELGGVDRLMEFVNDRALIKDMTNHFPIGKARMSQILDVLLGMPYSVWLSKHGVRRKKVPGHEV